jgi:hypothetical protein
VGERLLNLDLRDLRITMMDHANHGNPLIMPITVQTSQYKGVNDAKSYGLFVFPSPGHGILGG